MNRLFLHLSVFVSKLLQQRKQQRDFKRLDAFVKSEVEYIDALPLPIGNPIGGTMIVKCDDIGDFLLWQQVIPAIKEHAEKPITFVGNIAIKPLVETWFDFADHYVWIEKPLWESEAYRSTIYAKIRKMMVNVAFTPLFTRNFRLDDMIVYASLAETKSAWNRKHHPYFPGLSAADPLSNRVISSDVPLELEYFRHIEFIERFYGVSIEHKVEPLFPNFSKQNRLVIFPAANTRSRWWHYRNYAQLIKRLAPHFDSIILLGGANAAAYAHKIELAANEPKLRNLCTQTSLTDLMPFIGESSVLVCPDTSAMHFGVLTATDTVVLSNGNNWQRFANYAPHVKSGFTLLFPPHFKPDPNRVKRLYSSAEIQAITVTQVEEAVLAHLAKGKASSGVNSPAV